MVVNHEDFDVVLFGLHYLKGSQYVGPCHKVQQPPGHYVEMCRRLKIGNLMSDSFVHGTHVATFEFWSRCFVVVDAQRVSMRSGIDVARCE